MNPLQKSVALRCRIEVKETVSTYLQFILFLFRCSLSNSVGNGHRVQHGRTVAGQRQRPPRVSSNLESIRPRAASAAHFLLLTLLSFASEHKVDSSVHLSPENKLSLCPSANVCLLVCGWVYVYVVVFWELCVHTGACTHSACVYVYVCVCFCQAVNLSCPAPSKKTDSPLRRTLQRKITTPTDKHTLVSV